MRKRMNILRINIFIIVNPLKKNYILQFSKAEQTSKKNHTLHGYILNFYFIPDEAKRSSGISSAKVSRFLHSQE